MSKKSEALLRQVIRESVGLMSSNKSNPLDKIVLTKHDQKALQEIVIRSRRIESNLLAMKQAGVLKEFVGLAGIAAVGAGITGLEIASAAALAAITGFIFAVLKTEAGQRLVVLILRGIRAVNHGPIRLAEVGIDLCDQVSDWLSEKTGLKVPVKEILDWIKIGWPNYVVEMTLDELIEWVKGISRDDWETITDAANDAYNRQIPLPSTAATTDGSDLSSADGPGNPDGMMIASSAKNVEDNDFSSPDEVKQALSDIDLTDETLAERKRRRIHR